MNRTQKGNTSASRPLYLNQNKQSYLFDDSPKAFKKLMHLSPQINGKTRSTQNDSSINNKLKSSYRSNSNPDEAQLQIRGGEKLSDFGARVDQALPIADLVRKSNKRSKDYHRSQEVSIKETPHSVRHVRNHKGMQEKTHSAAADHSKIVQKTESRIADDKIPVNTSFAKRGRLRPGSDVDHDKDPWGVLEAKRNKPLSLHDIAKSPPELQTLRRAKKMSKLGLVGSRANVSPRKREDLENARKATIKNYRRMMAERRNSYIQI